MNLRDTGKLTTLALITLLSGTVRAQDVAIGGRLAAAPPTDLQKPDRYAGVRIRVGVPLVARGPAPNIADAAFSAIQLPDGRFRGFTAAGTTWQRRSTNVTMPRSGTISRLAIG